MDISVNSSVIDVFKDSCQRAKSEDDVKLALAVFMSSIAVELGISYTNKSAEIPSLHGGRSDSIYDDIYFELKKLGLFKHSKNGVKEAVFGRNEKDHGLFHYLVNFSLDGCGKDQDKFEYLLFKKVGVAFDGEQFVFCRFKKSSTPIVIYDEYRTQNFPKTISKTINAEFEQTPLYSFDEGVKRLLLYARSTNKKTLDANNLCAVFSNKAAITQKIVPYLYSHLEDSLVDCNRVKTLYNEWVRIFGTIYEKQESDFVKHVSAITSMYPIRKGEKGIDVIKALFVLQTYYSVIVKLLIQNLFASLKLPMAKSSPLKYHDDVYALFSGKRDDFNSFIDNFYETNYFEWFTMSGEGFDLSVINEIIAEIEQFETTASIIKPEIVSDVLRTTYESLMPKELRHLMGEYYTPEWLVDFTIEKTKYGCGINESVLDPTCGSCVFITRLISKYIQRYSTEMEYDELIDHILENFVGFDINPIAVIQSKCNYILSLGDITKLTKAVSIPVYMCDSILIPTVHAKQKKGENKVVITTSIGKFEIPLLPSRNENDTYLRVMSKRVLEGFSYDEFKTSLEMEDGIILGPDEDEISKVLYNKLVVSHHAGKDGFWPILLKNSFAPLFSKQRFDYIVGNPPWIAWKAMSESYRKLTLDIWLSYGIFEKNAYDKITSHDDFAMAVTYVSIDHYLKEHGVAGFILPQTFVKSLKGGEGFRKFCITRDGKNEPFAVEAVYDMLRIAPFKGIANNKASVYIFRKNKEMVYPMKHYYDCVSSKPIRTDDEYADIKDLISFDKLSASPINDDPRSPWLTVDDEHAVSLKKYLGKSDYTARKGIEPCGAKGIYLVKVTGKRGKKVKIENCIERSRRPDAIRHGVHPGWVEPDLVYPMLGGRNFTKWGIKDNLFMVVPHETTGNVYHGMDVHKMRTTYPSTYSWLYFFHDVLLASRVQSAKFFDPKVFPWYRLDNVGDYSFKPYKVLWKEQSKGLDCCVVSSLDDPYLGKKVFVVDSKVLFVALDDKDEAFYLSAVLNSSVVDHIIHRYTISTNKGIDVVKNIRIPKYDAKNKSHKKLASLGAKAHTLFVAQDVKGIKVIEKQIDKLIPKIF